MGRYFNTTGPCNPDRHYMLPPSARLVGAQLQRYLSDELYWVLHAPRQTGKTTFLMSWMRELNAAGSAAACYVSVEICQGIAEPERALPAIVANAASSAELQMGRRPPELPSNVPVLSMLSEFLRRWAADVAPKPLVILFDEVDVLVGETMVSFLRQLRSGFADRGVGKFPVSVALVGMRDLRDYLIKAKDGVPVNPGSPFNIKQNSATLGNFSQADVAELIRQHVEEKGQPFEPVAIELIYHYTRGQPWLVNALCQKCVWELVPEETRAPVTAEHIRQAKELLITERAVHLDSLGERLKDPRVRRVVEPILVGKADPEMADGDDFRLCLDLGLVTVVDGTPEIANPIYREVIPRVLNQGMQYAIPAPEFRWQRDDGTLDMPVLLREFQDFWRQHSEEWERKASYPEAFPHLLVMAFLQRITNGGGRIEREYAAGRGRVDLAVEWHGRWSVIEIKLVQAGQTREAVIEKGLIQVAGYRDRLKKTEGVAGFPETYLLVFDRRPEARARPWEERLTWETRPDPLDASRPPITVVGA